MAAFGPSGGAGLSAVGDVNVDGSTLEINADTLRVKDAGVTPAKISATGSAGSGKVPVSDGAGGWVWTDAATQAELDTHAALTTTAHGGLVSTFNSRGGAVTPGNADYLAVASGGLTGATQATRFVGATTSGAPGSGTFAIGDYVIDRTGQIHMCITAGTPGTWTCITKSRAQLALDGRGLITENWHVETGTGATAPADQLAYFESVGLKAGDVVHGIALVVRAGGTTGNITLAKTGLYQNDGTRLAISADNHTAFGTNNTLVETAFTGTYTVTADGLYYASFLFTGANFPTLWRGANDAAPGNALTGAKLPYTAQSGQTDLPTNATVTGATSNPSYWVGVY